MSAWARQEREGPSYSPELLWQSAQKKITCDFVNSHFHALSSEIIKEIFFSEKKLHDGSSEVLITLSRVIVRFPFPHFAGVLLYHRVAFLALCILGGESASSIQNL